MWIMKMTNLHEPRMVSGSSTRTGAGRRVPTFDGSKRWGKGAYVKTFPGVMPQLDGSGTVTVCVIASLFIILEENCS